jgi:hypothetical protein
MRNFLFILLASLPFCIPTLYINKLTNIPSDICLAGFRTAEFDNTLCVPCENNTYNHGQMPSERINCYTSSELEIILVNSTAVKCISGWKGEPNYINGKYQYGCYDPENTTNGQSLSSLLCKNCNKPSPFPTRWPDPSAFPTKFPTKFPTRFPTKFPNIQTPRPSGKPTKNPTKKKKKPTPYPTPYITKNPTTQPIIAPPPPHTIIIHHHDGNKESESTNKYDMGIAGIVISAIILIIGGVLCYKKKMKKYRRRVEQEHIGRNMRLSSNIELPNYQSDPYMQSVVMGSSLSEQEPTRNIFPIGKTISDTSLKKVQI